MWVFFVLEPARLLKACKPGSRARMDSATGPTHPPSVLRTQNVTFLVIHVAA